MIKCTQEEVDTALKYLRGENAIPDKLVTDEGYEEPETPPVQLTRVRLYDINKGTPLGPLVQVIPADGRQRTYHFKVFDESYVLADKGRERTVHTAGQGYKVTLNPEGIEVNLDTRKVISASTVPGKDLIDRILLFQTTPEFSSRIRKMYLDKA